MLHCIDVTNDNLAHHNHSVNYEVMHEVNLAEMTSIQMSCGCISPLY